MRFVLRCSKIGAALAATALAVPAWAAEQPTVEQAMVFRPLQKDVQFESPATADVAKCTIKPEQLGGQSGWVVRNAAGEVLRRFVDTNGDNFVDLWCYYDAGVEVYRDVDTNFNGKADQYRWMNTAGCRWGVDADEDGRIDSWKVISAEEATAELVAALAGRDAARFKRLLITPGEVAALGLGAESSKDLTGKVTAPDKAFESIAAKQTAVKAGSKWLHFGGTRPGVVPAGTEGSTKDVYVYENVVAMVETDGQHGQLEVGTLVRVGDSWRLLPEGSGFFEAPLANRFGPNATQDAGNDAASQELMAKLEQLDKQYDAATSAAEKQKLLVERFGTLERIADAATTPEDRTIWVRQLADAISAAVNTDGYTDGVARLEALQKKLKAQPGNEELAGYVEFRAMTARYTASLQGASPDFVKIQGDWLTSLENYVKTYPKGPDTAEALLQLAIGREFAGQEDEAKKWYEQIVRDFPGTATADKAHGARTRLDSVGKTISLKGKAANGAEVDLARLQGKVVLIHYWATWCEPCKTDLETIKNLLAKYGKEGFTAVGISLDQQQQDLVTYVNRNRLSWPQLWEKGGLESPLANRLGILTLPTMILLDKQGKVVNRNVQIGELDRNLGTMLR